MKRARWIGSTLLLVIVVALSWMWLQGWPREAILTSDDTIVLEGLEASQRTGELGDLYMEYWVGGGPPPPLRRSDQLRIHDKEGQARIELIQPRYGYPATLMQPGESFPNDVRSLEAEPADVRAMAGLIIGLIKDGQPSGEREPEPGELTREVVVRRGAIQLTRRYPGNAAGDCSSLDGFLDVQGARLEQSGTHRVSMPNGATILPSNVPDTSDAGRAE